MAEAIFMLHKKAYELRQCLITVNKYPLACIIDLIYDKERCGIGVIIWGIASLCA